MLKQHKGLLKVIVMSESPSKLSVIPDTPLKNSDTGNVTPHAALIEFQETLRQNFPNPRTVTPSKKNTSRSIRSRRRKKTSTWVITNTGNQLNASC